MTANTEATAEPSFINSVTSQEEGVFVAMESSVQQLKSDDNKVKSKMNKGSDAESSNAAKTTDVNFRRGYSRASSDGGGALEDYELDDVLFSSSVEDTGPVTLEKCVEMTVQVTPVTASNSNENEEAKPPSVGYYTTAPTIKASGLSFLQTLREYRHNRCIMTPLSTLVLLAILLSSLISLLFTIPQFIIGLFLGPLVKRQLWLVEFLYRWDIARWGHVKLMELAGKKNGGNSKKVSNGKEANEESTSVAIPKDPKKKLKHLGLLGHSDTIHQRITVVPGRVYVHPIPQFVDNVCYLIVCLPETTGTTAGNNKNEAKSSGLPIIGILIDVGEAKRTLAYMECIYEQFYEQEYPRSDYYRNSGEEEGNINTAGMGIEIHAILSTHR
jgi:hypothetical protein